MEVGHGGGRPVAPHRLRSRTATFARGAISLGEAWDDRLDARRRSRAGRSCWARRGMTGWTRGAVRGGAVLAERSDGTSGASVPPLVNFGPYCEPAYRSRPNPPSRVKAANRVPAVLVMLREAVLDKNPCTLSQIHNSRRNRPPPHAGCAAQPESYATHTKKDQVAVHRACISIALLPHAGAGRRGLADRWYRSKRGGRP